MEHTAKYAEALRQVAKELDTPCVDVYQAMLDYASGISKTTAASTHENGVLNDLLCDGLHFSTLGNRLLFNEVRTWFQWDCRVTDQKIMGAIDVHYPGMSVDRNPMEVSPLYQFHFSMHLDSLLTTSMSMSIEWRSLSSRETCFRPSPYLQDKISITSITLLN